MLAGLIWANILWKCPSSFTHFAIRPIVCEHQQFNPLFVRSTEHTIVGHRLERRTEAPPLAVESLQLEE